MSEDLKLTDEQRRAQLAHAETEARRLRQELGESEPGSRGGENGGGGDVSARVREEDTNADLFNRLSPAELTNLYLNDRPRWEQVIEAKERAGIRKLLRKTTS